MKLGVLSNRHIINEDFQFTCSILLPVRGYFSNSLFQIQKLVAFGTKEGPIILFNFTENSLQPVSLLIGHTDRVTSLHFLNHTFVSVSVDGTFNVWNVEDGECLYSHFRILNRGEHLLVKSNSPNTVFCWSFGFSAFLIDLTTGTITEKHDFFGLTSFFVFQNSRVFSSPFDLYLFNEKSSKQIQINIELNTSVFPSEYGIALLCDHTITFLDVSNLSFLFEYKNNLNQTSFHYLLWNSSTQVWVTTILGEVLFLTFGEKQVKSCTNFHLGMFSPIPSTHLSFLFLPRSKKIDVFSHQNYIFSFTPRSNTYLCSVPNSTQSNLLDSMNLSSFSLSSFSSKTAFYHQDFETSKITCLHSRFIRSKIEIVCGLQDGLLAFYSQTSKEATAITPVFSVPIVMILDAYPKKSGYLVFGADGSAALVAQNSVQLHYRSRRSKLVSVYFFEQDELFCIEYEDQLFQTFDFQISYPLSTSLHLPDIRRDPSPSNFFHIRSSHNIPYAVVDFESLSSENIRNYFPFNVFDSPAASPIPRSHSSRYGFTRSLSVQHGFGHSDDQFGKKLLSMFQFCLIGKNDNPTFFFPYFSIQFNSLFNCSSNILSRLLIVLFCNQPFPFEHFDSIRIEFIKMIESPNEHLSLIAFKILVLSFKEKYQSSALMKTSFDSLSLPEALDNAIRMMKLKQVQTNLSFFVNFLLKTADKNRKMIGFFSILILLNSFNLFENPNDLIDIFFNIIKIMITSKLPKQVKEAFVLAAQEHFGFFKKAYWKIIEDQKPKNREFIEFFFPFMTQIGFSNSRFDLKTLVSKLLMKTVSRSQNLLEYVMKEIENHSKQCSSVAFNSPFVAIGMSSGTLYVYNEAKRFIKERLFDTPINTVSISPHKEYLVLISNQASSAKRIKFSTHFSFRGFSNLTELSIPPGATLKVHWVTNSEAKII